MVLNTHLIRHQIAEQIRYCSVSSGCYLQALVVIISLFLPSIDLLADERYFPSPGYLIEPQSLLDKSSTETSQNISESAVDQSRTVVVDRIQKLSRQIDSFFLNRFFGEQIISDDDYSGSRAKLAVITEHRPGQLLDIRTRANLRLVLPNTDDRLSLLFEAEDEEEDNVAGRGSNEGDGLNAAVRFIVSEKNRWRTNLDAGVRSGLPPKIFIRARSQRFWFIDAWSLRFRQTLGYFSHEGPASTTEFRSDYLFNRYQFFRFSSAAKYLLDDKLFELDNRIQLFRELNSRSAIALGVQALGNTSKETDIYQYQLEFRLRHQLWRSWFFVEVAPALEWADIKDFEVTPLITFKLEALFDNY